MPLYFFDFHDDASSTDATGVVCANPADAAHEAATALCFIAAESVRAGKRPDRYAVSVHLKDGEPVYAATLTLRETVL